MRRLAWAALAAMVVVAFVRADNVAKELERFQGKWSVELIAENGLAEPDSETKKFTITVKGARFFVKIEDREETMDFKIDPEKSPKNIDITPNYGDDKGKTAPGIYEFDGDRLRICACPKGMRPKQFATKQGTMVLVLKRIEP